MSWIALDHLVSWFKNSVGNLADTQLFMVSFLGRNDWRISSQREMDTWVWHQVCLKLCQIDIQSAVKSQWSCDWADNLSDQSVQIGISWPLNVQVTAANVINGLVIDHECAVGMFQRGVGGQNWVVGLDNSGWNLWSWVDGKLQLGLLAIVNW